MLAASASLLNIPVVILDVGEHAPAKQILAPRAPDLAHVDGSFTDPDKIRDLAAKVDVLTVEIEHIDVDVLEQVQNTHSVQVHPAPSTVRIIQDKFRQKEHLLSAMSPSRLRRCRTDRSGDHGCSCETRPAVMLKSRTLAYDGRGNSVVRDMTQLQEALDFLGGGRSTRRSGCRLSRRSPSWSCERREVEFIHILS